MAGAAPALVAIAVGRMSDVGGAISERIDDGDVQMIWEAQSTRAGPGVSDTAHVHGYSYRILRALGAHIGHTCSLPSHARAARVWHECLDTYSIVGPPRVRMVIFSSYRAAHARFGSRCSSVSRAQLLPNYQEDARKSCPAPHISCVHPRKSTHKPNRISTPTRESAGCPSSRDGVQHYGPGRGTRRL